MLWLPQNPSAFPRAPSSGATRAARSLFPPPAPVNPRASEARLQRVHDVPARGRLRQLGVGAARDPRLPPLGGTRDAAVRRRKRLAAQRDERPFASCDQPRCVLLRDPADADAVAYHSYDLVYFPWILARLWLRSWWWTGRESAKQKLVLYNLEPPSRWGRHAWLLNGVFDWVASYRADSDVPLRYTFFKLVPNNSSMPNQNTQSLNNRAAAAPVTTRGHNYAAGRTRLAFILTSHCDVPSDRLAFIRSLQTSLAGLQAAQSSRSRRRPTNFTSSSASASLSANEQLAHASRLDVLGGCGRSCRELDCDMSALARTYKFYLAFENARCTDYVSEKFWERGLSHELVPIVNGGRGAASTLVGAALVWFTLA